MKKLILLIITLAACVLLAVPACAATVPDEEETHPAGAIVINPNDLWQVIVAVGSGIIVISGAGGVIVGLVHKIKSPNEKQNERIAALETGFKEIKERLDAGDKHFASDAQKIDELEKTMKDSNKIIIKSLRALTAHAIDGNNIDKLRSSEEDINDFLADRL